MQLVPQLPSVIIHVDIFSWVMIIDGYQSNMKKKLLMSWSDTSSLCILTKETKGVFFLLANILTSVYKKEIVNNLFSSSPLIMISK